MILDILVRSFSVFNTILLFWLGLMVLFIGERRSAGTWLVGVGLLLGGLFFTSHTVIMAQNLAKISLGMDIWWAMAWTPGILAPLAWYGAVLWYAKFSFKSNSRHRYFLVFVCLVTVSLIIQIILMSPVVIYSNMIGRVLLPVRWAGGYPLIILTYIFYSVLCYVLPLHVLRKNLFSDNPLAATAFIKARPWLLAASVSLLLATAIMAWTAMWMLTAVPTPSLQNVNDLIQVKKFDWVVQCFVSAGVILLGRAVVGYEVFTGRELLRIQYSQQWRKTVSVILLFSLIMGVLMTIPLQIHYAVILFSIIFAAFSAVNSRRFYFETTRTIREIRPFLASSQLTHQLIGKTKEDQQSPMVYFQHLCHDVLQIPYAVLMPARSMQTYIGLPLIYDPFQRHYLKATTFDDASRFSSPTCLCVPGEMEGIAWQIPIRDQDEVIGLFVVGEKVNGNPFTEEEIEIAKMAGEKILDMVAGTEMIRVSMSLLRARVAELRVVEGQGRRILHDEILPEIHTAILLLNQCKDVPEAAEAVNLLGSVHHKVSDAIRETPALISERLARGGLMDAIQRMILADYPHAFASVHYAVDDVAVKRLKALPEFMLEVIFFAVKELVRNAARHASGNQSQRKVTLNVGLCDAGDYFELFISDDGVGMSGVDSSRHIGGNGIRFHSGMLTAIGCSISLGSEAGTGTHAVIHIPSALLKPDQTIN